VGRDVGEYSSKPLRVGGARARRLEITGEVEVLVPEVAVAAARLDFAVCSCERAQKLEPPHLWIWKKNVRGTAGPRAGRSMCGESSGVLAAGRAPAELTGTRAAIVSEK
jgi:hypothetical protein